MIRIGECDVKDEIKYLITRLVRELSNCVYGCRKLTIENNSDIVFEQKECKETFAGIEAIPLTEQFWGVGALAVDGMVYFIPANGGQILSFEEKTKKIETFGDFSRGDLLFSNGVLYKEKIYILPRKANSVVEVDYKQKSCREIELGTEFKTEHHYSGIVTENGTVYMPPRNTNTILKIDLNSMLSKEIPIGFKFKRNWLKYRYSGIVYHTNRLVYMIPEYDERVIKFNPETEKISFVGQYLKDTRVIAPVEAKDGNIYGYLMFDSGIIKIDIKNESVEIIERGNVGRSCGTVNAVNGKLYNIPAYDNEIYEFDVDKKIAKRVDLVDDLNCDKAACAMGVNGNDGRIYATPCHGNKLVIYKFV